MGYSEIHCIICGVSFSIGRLRTRSEPRSHAWCYYGGGFYEQYEVPGDTCGDSTGCALVDRDKSEDDFMSLETDPKSVTRPTIGGMGPLEHIAGPGCQCRDGYNGNKVSTSVVRRVRIAQCITRKPTAEDDDITNEQGRPPVWSPAADDEPWEETSAWMLTGLTSKTQERETGDTQGWFPVRHGVAEFWADEINFDHMDDFRAAMPFHPWCLEVYQRAAFAQKGKVDVDGLGEWWEQSDRMGGADEVEGCMGLEGCNGQYWEHTRGMEFLIMDPLKDAGFAETLREALDESDTFDPSRSAFPERSSPPPSIDEQHDPFLSLPPELLQQILTELPTCSIGAVREASRAFTHIPISFFYHLLRKDFPWIWEVDPETSSALPRYSKWIQKVMDDAAREPESDTFDQPEDPAEESSSGVQEGTTSAATEDATVDVEKNEEFIEPVILPRYKTNWFRLYASLRKTEDSIPGLRNRERIWRGCGEIVKKIDEMRVRDEEAAKWA